MSNKPGKKLTRRAFVAGAAGAVAALTIRPALAAGKTLNVLSHKVHQTVLGSGDGDLMAAWRKANDAEIAAVFSVPLEFFRSDPRELTHRIDYLGRSWYVPSYTYGEFRIWGLTAIMVVELVNLLYDDAQIALHQPPEHFIHLR